MSWPLMGRFGLLSLDYGAFIIVGTYVTASMIRYALDAISGDEEPSAAAAACIYITRTKLKITVLSTMVTALGGFGCGFDAGPAHHLLALESSWRVVRRFGRWPGEKESAGNPVRR
jgi:ABC-type branched-subunit amino acid transport system permease subunit